MAWAPIVLVKRCDGRYWALKTAATAVSRKESEVSAYIIVYRESPVTDSQAIQEYSRRNRENVAAFQGGYGVQPLVTYGAIEALEGDAPDGVVVLRFPDMKAARGWYYSDEYQSALAFRMKAADWRVVLVEGFD